MSLPIAITYSPAYTLVPTYECFNRCTYCNFRRDPGGDEWLSIDAARSILTELQHSDVCEILILSGEVHPNSTRRSIWFDRIYQLGKLALEMGFLPHTNAGILTELELEKLAEVNVSLGLMLESVDEGLLTTVHRFAPSKQIDLRLETIALAGKLKIPFTTGLLLGIGESEASWVETLQAIDKLDRQWGHIQEIILQPYQPGTQEVLAGVGFDLHKLPHLVTIAREILADRITIQIPPNLITDRQIILDCLAAGVRDLGGIVPKDEVNPDYHHTQIDRLAEFLQVHNYQLQPRLPIYPTGDRYLAPDLRQRVDTWRDRVAMTAVRRSGSPAFTSVSDRK
jgi:7,8-didemethyl-8-hydroxy-5-deazariboflavin synthase